MLRSNSTRSKTLDFVELLRALTREVLLQDRRVCAPRGLSSTQWQALHALEQGNCLGMNDLAQELQISRSTISRIVDQLERKELLTRKSDPRDRRQLRLELSEAGYRVHDDILEELIRSQQVSLATMPRARWNGCREALAELRASARRASRQLAEWDR